MVRHLLGGCSFLAVICTVAVAADPTRDEALAHLEKIRGKSLTKKGGGNIAILDLSRKKVTDNDLKYVGVLTTIRQLHLGAESTKDKKGQTIYKASGITDEGLKSLAGLTQLQKLELDGANITDAGLKHIAAMKNLTDLGLSGTKVTDEGMGELKQLPKLQRLVLYDTKITDTGVSILKRWKLELNILR